MFNLRRFTSLSLVFSFLLMSYTGIMLFISPQGKYAYWLHWKFLALSKTQYANLHVSFMILFLTGMILHLYLNYKPLLAYLKNKQKDFSLLTKEFILAFGLSLFFFVGTLMQITPFDTFLNFNHNIKSSWVTEKINLPYAHAELSSLKSLTKKSFLDLDKVISTLKERGFDGVDADTALEKIARLNHVSPAEIFQIINIKENTLEGSISKEAIKKSLSKVIQPSNRSGLGKMTLKEVSEKFNIDIEKALKYLKQNSIQADENSRMKPLSEELNITPKELLEAINK